MVIYCANTQVDLNLRWTHRSESTISDVEAQIASTLFAQLHGNLNDSNTDGSFTVDDSN